MGAPAGRTETCGDPSALPLLKPNGSIRPTVAEFVLLAFGCALLLAHAWHLDDAFVYFRYVDNWVLYGRGPVFNAGEWVEGYTSPLWLLALAGLRATIATSYWTLTQIIGAAAFVCTWWMLVRARAAGARGAERPVPNLALALLAGHYAISSYFTSGTESPLVLVVAAAFVLFAYERTSRLAQVLVGIAPLVRPELALALVVVLVCDRRRAGRWPSLAIAVACTTSGAWMLFRIWAYADLVPNTFHLKDGEHFAWGIAYLHDALAPYGGYFVVLGALGLAAFGSRPLAAARWSLILAGLVVAAYVVRIGGDGRHFRYVLFPYVLLAGATLGYAPRWIDSSQRATWTTIALAFAAAIPWPRQLDRHPLLAGVREARVGVVRDAQFHRALPELRADVVAPGPGPLTSGFGVTGWCQEAWRSPDAGWIHKDGLTEPAIAHSDATPFRPAHFDTTLDVAEEIAYLRAKYGGRGAYRRAIEAGDATPWVAANLVALERLEARIYNRHDWQENIRLALQRIPTIRMTSSFESRGRSRSE